MAVKNKKTVFFCKECGFEVVKWQGQCPGCKEWNSLVEGISEKKNTSHKKVVSEKTSTVKLSEISLGNEDRISTGLGELDRVLGGGIIKGSLVLVGGDPGIGKSTILLQVCKNISENKKVLYVSGEESQKQIKSRADRIGKIGDNFLLLCETDIEDIEQVIKNENPEMVVIDSIQTMYHGDISSAAGSASQVRECTNIFMQIAKGLSVSIFIIGHVTKEGVVAGPKMLEHMVDTVLYFEGDRFASYRIIRGVKNRFGSTNEIGVFEMREDGLSEVPNPSEYMLSGRVEEASGTIITCSLSGTRPILIEIQALVCKTNFGIPRRTSVGTDNNRVNLLMAVLEQKAGIHINDCDAYVNIAGGMKINEPSLDLGIIMALVSSFRDKKINSKTIVFGEVGLAGEVRSVSMVEQRISEACKLGFETCIVPASAIEGIKKPNGIRIIGVKNIREAIACLE